jgi:hypothetical protein
MRLWNRLIESILNWNKNIFNNFIGENTISMEILTLDSGLSMYIKLYQQHILNSWCNFSSNRKL